jgi:two-component system NtrC family response regulator
MNERRLLLVDDDPGILRGLRWSFDRYEVLTADGREAALRQVKAHRPQVVTLDLGLPPSPDDATEGLRTLGEILAIAPDTKVVVVTGNEDRRNAVEAVALGAYDFYQKPIDAEVLSLIVSRAFGLWELERENRRLAAAQRPDFCGIVTASPAMQRLCRMVEKVAPTDASVLVLGESGTGKELVAKALHELSGRKGAFVAINCGAIPENLLESELFGHEKGAFTGAIRQVKGKIENAHRGTLFLDEIGDMPMPLQVKLLRFLQERVIERVGGRERIPVDVRLVCATHRDLEARIAEGQFREDLFYRVNEIPVRIPALRERDDDGVVLARHFLGVYGEAQGRRRLRLGTDAIAAIRAHAWSGNVRELENKVKRAVIMADGQVVTADDLGLAAAVPAGEGAEAAGVATLRELREAAERRALAAALAAADGNLSEVAKLLGVSRPTVYSLLKQHNLQGGGSGGGGGGGVQGVAAGSVEDGAAC